MKKKDIRIMVVDDDPFSVDLLQELFEDEYDMSAASSGEEALSGLHEFEPHIVLLDIMMPGMDGYEVCSKIRADQRYSEVKILLISARTLVKDRIKGYQAGADDYVVKPFDKDELYAKIKVFVKLVKAEQERNKAELDRRDSEERFREFVEGTDDLVTQVDSDGRFLYVNHAAEKTFGVNQDECLGRSAFDFVHPQDRDQTRETFLGWIRDRQYSATFENRQVNQKTGRTTQMIWMINFHYDSQGNPIKINSIAQDITVKKRMEEELKTAHGQLEKKVEQRTAELSKVVNNLHFEMKGRQQMEEALKESERKHRLLSENSLDVIWVMNLDLIFTYVNPSIQTKFGYAPSEWEGSRLSDHTLTDEFEQIQAIIAQEMKDVARHTGVNFESKMIHKNGRPIDVEINGKILLGEDGHPVGFQGSTKDITERKSAEADLTKSQQNVLNAKIGIIMGMAKLAEYRDQDTGSHLERIQEYVRLLSNELGNMPRYKGYISDGYIRDLCQSSILHDIGKVGVPDSILLKPGKLSPEEFTIIKQHSMIGGDAITTIDSKLENQSFLTLGKEVAYYHHEKWNGNGYPRGLKGAEIPLSARITALADVYDALTTVRPYKKAFSHEKARDIIVKDTDTHFDPDVVESFLAAEDEFDRVRQTMQDGETAH
ncbi:MAG: PAS domain S-box protein [Proteobacteria bacterium]|nr:PAS domain S-box protein [Pseudomonadota bacterium]